MAAQTVYRCYFLSTSRVISDAVFLSPSEIDNGGFCALFSSDHGDVAVHSPVTALSMLTTAAVKVMMYFPSFCVTFIHLINKNKVANCVTANGHGS